MPALLCNRTNIDDGLDIILQKDAAANIRGRYFRGLAIDEPWQRIDYTPAGGNKTTETNRTYLADGLGSIVALTDPNKTITTEYDYQPFGVTTNSGAGNKNAYKFTAREDDGTGFYYYRARYCHPALGRFVSEDPIGFAGGDFNLYSYVSSNPLNGTDPSGEIAPLVIGVAVGVAILFSADFALAPEIGSDGCSGEKDYSTYQNNGTAEMIGNLVVGQVCGAVVGKVFSWFRSLGSVEIQATAETTVSAATPVGRRLGGPLGTVARNTPATIAGRVYTGHALDQMQARGLVPSVIEDTIAQGTRTAGRNGATIFTTPQARVIVNPNGSVKTVMPQ